MTRSTECQSVLDAEVCRWSAIPWPDLVSALHDLLAYEIKLGSETYQVEVALLENMENYIHVMVAVDDGKLPRSLSPLTQTFVREKHVPSA